MAKAKFQKGDLVEVVGVTSGHNVPVGTIANITSRQNGYYMIEGFGLWIQPQDLESVANTIEALEKQMTKKQKEVDVIKDKIAFLNETGVEKFCQKEFKAYRTLKLLQDNSDMSLIEKAKKIAELYG